LSASLDHYSPITVLSIRGGQVFGLPATYLLEVSKSQKPFGLVKVLSENLSF